MNRQKNIVFDFSGVITTAADAIFDVIAKLAAKHTLFIVSSLNTNQIKQYLAQHNLDQYFDQVLGYDVASSKVEKFKMIFDQYQITADQTVLITDTLGDLREANEVNIPTIAVTWGFHDEATLQKGSPTHIINKPEQLLDIID